MCTITKAINLICQSICIRHVLAIVLTCTFLGGCCSPFAKEDVFLSSDYSRDIPKRKEMLRMVAESKGRIGYLLKTGGILAFRDYLVYLGTRKPDYAQPVDCMSTSLRQRDNIAVGNIIDTEALSREGLINTSLSVKYTYYEIAQVIERTIDRWEMDDIWPEREDSIVQKLNIGVSPVFRLRKVCEATPVNQD